MGYRIYQNVWIKGVEMYLEIFASIGLILLFIAFYFENTGKYDKKHIKYNILNCIGSLILGIYAVIITNYIFIVLEFIWFGISLYYLLIRLPAAKRFEAEFSNTFFEDKSHHSKKIEKIEE